MSLNNAAVIHRQEYTKYLHCISQATDKIKIITDRLLHFSRTDMRQIERMELDKYTEKNVARYSAKIDAELIISMDKTSSYWIEADAKQIDEVFLNLLSNAKEAMSQRDNTVPSKINLSLQTIEK